MTLNNARGYRPTVPLERFDVKLLKVRSRPRPRPRLQRARRESAVTQSSESPAVVAAGAAACRPRDERRAPAAHLLCRRAPRRRRPLILSPRLTFPPSSPSPPLRQPNPGQPQNILGMLQAGTRDVGFGGADWVQELGITGLVHVLDTGMDPVRIVAAAPDPGVLARGRGYGGRRLVVASEYVALTTAWLAAKGVDAVVMRAYGATESLPPEDADVIVDNAATGSTLKANALEIIDTIMTSSTQLYASAAAWAHPAKRARIQEFAAVLKSVLDARKRLMVTFNISGEKLEPILASLPAARAPTVSPLHGPAGGFAVQIAVETGKVPGLLPFIRAAGGSDIAVTQIKMLMA